MRLLLLSISFFALSMTLLYNYQESIRTKQIAEALQDLSVAQRLRGQEKFEAWYFYSQLEVNEEPASVQFERFHNSAFFSTHPLIRHEELLARHWQKKNKLTQLRQALTESKIQFNHLPLDPNNSTNLVPVLDWINRNLDIISNLQDLNSEFNRYLSETLSKNIRTSILINLAMLVFIGSCWFYIYHNRQKELFIKSQVLNKNLIARQQELQISQRVMTSIMEDLKIEKANALDVAINYQQLASIVEQSSEAILKLDTDGTINRVNPAALILLHRPIESLLNKNLATIFGEQNKSIIDSSIDKVKALLNKTDIQIEVPSFIIEGDISIFEIHFSPLQSSEKSLIGISVFLRDITSMILYQKQLSSINSRLQEKNREMEQFIYTISHDLKSPLVTIGAFTKKLQTTLEEKSSEKEKHQLRRIQANVVHMETLLNELLNLSRVIRQEISKEWLDTDKVVNKVLNTLESSIKECNANISISSPLDPIFANEHQFYQCVQNLIANAIKYRKPDCNLVISIQTKKLQYWSEFIIMDNGLGIDAKYHQQIFNIFERLDIGEGSGVGLAIIKTIMEKHLGQVVLNSAEGEGSTFKLIFPNSNNAIADTQPQSAVG